MCLILLPQEISRKTFNTDHSGAQRSHTDQHRNLVGGNHSFLSEWIQIPLPSRIGAIKHTLKNHLGLHIRLQSTVSHGDLLFLPVILRINCNKVNNFCIYFNLSRYKYTAPVLNIIIQSTQWNKRCFLVQRFYSCPSNSTEIHMILLFKIFCFKNQSIGCIHGSPFTLPTAIIRWDFQLLHIWKALDNPGL